MFIVTVNLKIDTQADRDAAVKALLENLNSPPQTPAAYTDAMDEIFVAGATLLDVRDEE